MATARKLPSGSWRVQVFDYTDKNGNKHYKSFTGNSKSDAEMKALKYSMNKSNKTDYGELTLYEAIDKYINSSDGVLSPTTISGYRGIQKNAFQFIMHTN